MEAPRIVVITGLSGAGRSTAARALEDLGYFCIDNMPTALLPGFAHLCASNEVTLGRVALVIDIREREFFHTVTTHLATLRDAGFEYEIVFLEATTDTVVQRYSESRRRHPMADAADDLRGAVEAERSQVDDLRRQAAVVVDTSHLNVHQLRRLIQERYADRDSERIMQVQLVSFGYKYGVPGEADLLLDVRFLPNPHYDAALRPLTGLEPPVKEYVLNTAPAQAFVERVDDLLTFLIPEYAREGKSYLTVGFGCTGGRHRSVAIAVELAHRLMTRLGYEVRVHHRDLSRGEE